VATYVGLLYHEWMAIKLVPLEFYFFPEFGRTTRIV